jgi:hypothetical protein
MYKSTRANQLIAELEVNITAHCCYRDYSTYSA